MTSGAGRVVLAGAPLGNPGDASPRLRDVLLAAAVIAAEDTRRFHRLCADLGITPSGRVISFFEANETARVPQLLAELGAGNDVVVITDAGMPSVSDPGFRLVQAALAHNFEVGVVPGASAVTTALALSGLAVDRFCFEGFLPRKPGERRRAIAGLRDERRTLVFFEAPHRIAATLAEMAEILGMDRPAAVCRELTKTYEQVVRGPLSELARASQSGGFKGEITLVVAGDTGVVAVGPDELAGAVAAREAAGQGRKEAIAAVAVELGQPKPAVFDAVVAAKAARA